MSNQEWVRLMTLNDEHEATIIESMLKAEQIMVLKKYRDIGDYLKIYMGTSNLGVDLLVPQDVYAQARELVTSIPFESDPSDPGEEGQTIGAEALDMGEEYLDMEAELDQNEEELDTSYERKGVRIRMVVIAVTLALFYLLLQLIGKNS